MSETITLTDPFEAAIQSGFQIPPIDELRTDQQIALWTGPGVVLYPVDGLIDFPNLDSFVYDGDIHFRRMRNNFHLHFILDRYDKHLEENGLENLRGITVPAPAIRRFQSIYPELAADIDKSVEKHLLPNGIAVNVDSLESEEGLTTLKKLYVAYKIGRQLVDARDDEDITAYYLVR